MEIIKEQIITEENTAPEATLNNNLIRVTKGKRQVILVDGTIKTMTFNRKYKVKSDRKVVGKSKLYDRIRLCNDQEKIIKVRQYMDEIGM